MTSQDLMTIMAEQKIDDFQKIELFLNTSINSFKASHQKSKEKY